MLGKQLNNVCYYAVTFVRSGIMHQYNLDLVAAMQQGTAGSALQWSVADC